MFRITCSRGSRIGDTGHRFRGGRLFRRRRLGWAFGGHRAAGLGTGHRWAAPGAHSHLGFILGPRCGRLLLRRRRRIFVFTAAAAAAAATTAGAVAAVAATPAATTAGTVVAAVGGATVGGVALVAAAAAVLDSEAPLRTGGHSVRWFLGRWFLGGRFLGLLDRRRPSQATQARHHARPFVEVGVDALDDDQHRLLLLLLSGRRHDDFGRFLHRFRDRFLGRRFLGGQFGRRRPHRLASGRPRRLTRSRTRWWAGRLAWRRTGRRTGRWTRRLAAGRTRYRAGPFHRRLPVFTAARKCVLSIRVVVLNQAIALIFGSFYDFTNKTVWSKVKRGKILSEIL